MKQKLYARTLVLLLGLPLITACPGPAPDDPHAQQQTKVSGMAPLHAGGQIRALDSSLAQIGNTVTADGAGRFTLELLQASGDIIIEASGGSYKEPDSGVTVHDGDRLRAMITGLGSMDEAKVVVSPWTEMATAASQARGADSYGQFLQFLTSAMTCSRAEYSNVLWTPPSLPSLEEEGQGTNVAALSYLYFGAWSKLAANLSASVGITPGGRINSLTLATALSKDASDGRIDGHQNGAAISLFENFDLPDDLLRQPLAQAGRRFADSKANLTQMKFADVRGLLGCLSNDKKTTLGAPGQALDENGPILELSAPSHESFLVDEYPFVCDATDDSAVVDIAASLLNPAGEKLQRGPKADSVDRSIPGKTSLRGTLEIEPHASGQLTFECRAKDAWDNETVVTRNYTVNKGGIVPQIKGIKADDDGRLRGRVTIECDCSEDPYNERCDLLQPAQATFHLRHAHKTTYHWETTNGLDGFYDVECANLSRGFNQATPATIRHEVKNNPNGRAHGTVYLDTPVSNVTITAYAYKDGEREGAILGSGEAQGGTFDFPMATTFRGPVLFKAVRTQGTSERATFRNLAIDDDMTLNNGYLTLLLDNYQPSDKATDLSINIASSLAEALATARWKLSHEVDDFATEIVRDQHLVAQHIYSSKEFDVRRTPVQNLSEPVPVGALEAERNMGLFHVGLSRLAAEFSAKRCEGGLTCITATDILEGLREDMADGKLDGYNGDLPVFIDHNESVGSELLRIDLSRAIKNWLDAAPFLNNADVAPKNASGLKAKNYAGKGQLLRLLAGDNSPLFGNREGRRYDQEGPVMHVKAMNRARAVLTRPEDDGQSVVTLVRPVNASFEVEVNAEDESQVLSIKAHIKDIELSNVEGGRPDRARFIVGLQDLDLQDGSVTLELTARDGENNVSLVHVLFVVDRVGPAVTLDKPEIWIRHGDLHTVTGTVTKANVRGALHNNGVKLADFETGGSQRFEARSPLGCNATHTLHIEFEDRAGNVTPVDQIVHCDDTPPTVTPISVPYTQARNNGQTQLAIRVHGATEAPAFDALTNAAQAAQVERRFYQLDNDSADLPTVRFTVTDQGKGIVGTDPNGIKVSYLYRFNGSKQRDWTPLPCAVEQDNLQCAFAFTYQALLPDEIQAQPLTTARARNFIARSKPEDLHAVMFKVEDSVGNTTVAEWSLRLDLVGPVFRISCDTALADSVAMKSDDATFGALLKSGAPLFLPRIDSDAPFTNSLAPTDARYVFSMPDTGVTWKIEEASVQWAKLGPSNQTPDWPKTFGKFVQFEGEAVQASTQPLDRTWDEEPRLSLQQLAVSRDRTLHLPFYGSQATALTTGQEAPSSLQWATTVDQKARLQYSYKFGRASTCQPLTHSKFEKNCKFKGSTEFDERRFAKNIKIIRAPYFPRLSDHGELPPPLRVEYADDCKADNYLIWHEGDPIFTAVDMSKVTEP
jgi:hypothetical protein